MMIQLRYSPEQDIYTLNSVTNVFFVVGFADIALGLDLRLQ